MTRSVTSRTGGPAAIIGSDLPWVLGNELVSRSATLDNTNSSCRTQRASVTLDPVAGTRSVWAASRSATGSVVHASRA